jgi:hypothetical protein
MNNLEVIDISKKSWAPLFRWSAYLSAVMLLFIPVQIVIFTVSPPPETVEGFFQLYKENWFLGLLSFDFIYILNNVIMIFIYLSLAVCLFQEKPAFSLTAFILGIVGVACYFPTNPAFEMLSLSQSYWSVLPEAHAQYLAAGETLLACYKGTAFDVYYVLNALSLLLFSAAIYKSPRFNKSIGSWGLASGILMIVPSSAGIIGMAFSLLSLVPWVVFLFMLSGKLYKLAKNTPNAIKTAFHE